MSSAVEDENTIITDLSTKTTTEEQKEKRIKSVSDTYHQVCTKVKNATQLLTPVVDLIAGYAQAYDCDFLLKNAKCLYENYRCRLFQWDKREWSNPSVNEATGIWTCHVAGLYKFDVSVTIDKPPETVQFALSVGSASSGYTYPRSGEGLISLHCSSMQHMEVGQSVSSRLITLNPALRRCANLTGPPSIAKETVIASTFFGLLSKRMPLPNRCSAATVYFEAPPHECKHLVIIGPEWCRPCKLLYTRSFDKWNSCGFWKLHWLKPDTSLRKLGIGTFPSIILCDDATSNAILAYAKDESVDTKRLTPSGIGYLRFEQLLNSAIQHQTTVDEISVIVDNFNIIDAVDTTLTSTKKQDQEMLSYVFKTPTWIKHQKKLVARLHQTIFDTCFSTPPQPVMKDILSLVLSYIFLQV